MSACTLGGVPVLNLIISIFSLIKASVKPFAVTFLTVMSSIIIPETPQKFIPIPFTRMGTYSERAIARVKKAYVLCSDSPYMMRKGDVYKNNVVAMRNIDGKLYIPVRTAIEAVEGELNFDETTKMITLSTEKNIVSFRDGATAEVNLNGNPHTLKNSIKNPANPAKIDFEDINLGKVEFKDVIGLGLGCVVRCIL